MILAGVGVVAIVAAGVVVVLSRRSHLTAWRLGVFYESEERYGDPPTKEGERDSSSG